MRKDLYYKITKERQDYKGVRYFRFNNWSESTIQVCVIPGEEKKGRGHTFGIYLIHRLTFLTNYLTMNYAVPCSKRQYDNAFKKVVKMLK